MTASEAFLVQASSARRRVALVVVVLGAALIASLVHARVRRAARGRDQGAIDAVATRVPSSDLALSGGARWLRFPSMEEPAAAFADGIALPDPDPAGGVMAPPREVWSLSAGGAP